MTEAVCSDHDVHIKPGLYDLKFESQSTAVVFGRAMKIKLEFSIVTIGEFMGARLYRYYNARGFIGKPGLNGRFKIGKRSDFVREYANLFGLPQSLKRMPIAKYEGVIIEGKVKTVSTGYNGKSIHEGLRYSVIEELIRVKQT